MYRVSTVYVPYINRISTVVDSGRVAEGTCPISPPKGGRWLWDGVNAYRTLCYGTGRALLFCRLRCYNLVDGFAYRGRVGMQKKRCN